MCKWSVQGCLVSTCKSVCEIFPNFSEDFFPCSAEHLWVSSKKTPFLPPLSHISCFSLLFFFHSFTFLSENKRRKRSGRGKGGGDRVSRGGKVTSQRKSCWDSLLNSKAYIWLNCFEVNKRMFQHESQAHAPIRSPLGSARADSSEMSPCPPCGPASLPGIPRGVPCLWEEPGEPHLWVMSPNTGCPEPDHPAVETGKSSRDSCTSTFSLLIWRWLGHLCPCCGPWGLTWSHCWSREWTTSSPSVVSQHLQHRRSYQGKQRLEATTAATAVAAAVCCAASRLQTPFPFPVVTLVSWGIPACATRCRKCGVESPCFCLCEETWTFQWRNSAEWIWHPEGKREMQKGRL